MTFQASGQDFTTFPASAPVTIPAHGSVSVPLAIALPRAPGDAPESVQFTAPGGLESSVPIARRTLIPSSGGLFSATLTSSVSRGPGRSRPSTWTCPQGSVTSTCRSTRRTTPPTTRCTSTCSRQPTSRLLSPSQGTSTSRPPTLANARQPDRPRLTHRPGSAARSVGDRRDAGRHDRRDGVLPARHRGGRLRPAAAGHRDWSPDVGFDDHRLRLQRPGDGHGHEHDQPRRATSSCSRSATTSPEATRSQPKSWRPGPRGR